MNGTKGKKLQVKNHEPKDNINRNTTTSKGNQALLFRAAKITFKRVEVEFIGFKKLYPDFLYPE